MIYVIACVAGLAGLLFGYDYGIIAGAIGPLHAEFTVYPLEEGMMIATVPLGAVVGTITAGQLAAPWGRRGLLICAALLFICGALICVVTPSIAILSLGRFFLGVAIGIAALVAPLYISETAPAAKRGMLVSIYQLAITLGALSAYLVDFAFEDSWRPLFATAVVPGFLLLIGMWRLSDTPRWLVLSGRRQEAGRVIGRLQDWGPKDPKLKRMLASIDLVVRNEVSSIGWRGLFEPMTRPALLVGTGLFFLQQLSGINAVIAFAPTVFDQAGFDTTDSQIVATIGVCAVNSVVTLVAMALVDRIGRRILLFISFAGAALSLGLIALAVGPESSGLPMLSLTGLVLYMAFFALAIGPLPWVMMSEIFPLNLRGPGMAAACLTNWIFHYLVVFTFPTLQDAVGIGGVFSLYAVVCVLGLLFTALYVPETTGLTLEEIEEHLKARKSFRALGAVAKVGEAGRQAP